MNHLFSFFLGSWLLLSNTPVEPGVSAALATRRAAILPHIHYDLSFRIPIEKDSAVLITESLQFDLAVREDLTLDFRQKDANLDRLDVNGQSVIADIRDEHILVPARLLRKGPNTIKLKL